MPFERAGDRRVAGISLAALLSLTPAVARAADPVAGQAGQTGQAVPPSRAKGDEVDAEVLRDLDVLDNPNYARDREIAKRLTFYERMRMLDRWLSNRPAPDGAPAPAEPAKREVR
jgi:hypothetical protein